MTASPGAAGYLLAADVGGTRVRMLLAQRDGLPTARWNAHLQDDGKHPAAVLALLRTGAQAMLATVSAGPLLHVTVGAPGATDVARGVVLDAPNLPGWRNVPLRDLLQQAFGVVAAVDNDTNLAALGEGAAGAASGVRDYVFCALGTGVGAGIVLDGKLLRGRHGTAGEIGYLQPQGTARGPVRMDETGALERQIGGLGIEARWRTSLQGAGIGEDSVLMALRAPQVFDRAATGDPLAATILHWSAELLADALLTLTLVLDPALVVLGGGVGAHPALCTAVRTALANHSLPVPTVVSSALGTEAQLHGAVATSLAALASPPPSLHRC